LIIHPIAKELFPGCHPDLTSRIGTDGHDFPGSYGIVGQGLHVIRLLVQYVGAPGGTKPNTVTAVLCDAGNGVAGHQIGRVDVGSEHLNRIAIVPAQAAAIGAVPEIALAILEDAVDTDHRQLALIGQGGHDKGGRRRTARGGFTRPYGQISPDVYSNQQPGNR